MQQTIDRDPRVRFKHPVRVVPIGGPPRAYRVLASNLSKDGMSLRMPTPFDTGTKVALSLEAGGRVLPFAQGEVVWRDLDDKKAPGRGAGFGVRFTGFLHPRAHELVDYLVANLETGKPLSAPEPAAPWRRRLGWIAAGVAAVVLGAGITTWALRTYRAEQPAIVAVQKASEPIAVKAEPHEQQPAAEGAGASAEAEQAAALPEEAAAQADATPPDEPAAKPEPTPTAKGALAATPEAVVKAKTEGTATPEVAVIGQGALAAAPEAGVNAKSEGSVKPEAAVLAKEEPTAKSEAQTVAIPSGAVRSIHTTVEGNQLALTLTLAPKAAITRAFTLRNPDRLAIDVRGAAPRKSHTVSASGVIAKVRVGKLPGGSRIVLDLSRAPGKPVVVSGNSVSVPLR